MCYSRRMKLAPLVVIGASVLLATGCVEQAEKPASTPLSPSPTVATEPPELQGTWKDFSFKTTSGETVTLADYKGKTLLVDVWSYT